jgi:hypothetical protein
MYKKPRVKNVLCPVCGELIEKSHVAPENCPLWHHIRLHHLFHLCSDADQAVCVCGEHVGRRPTGRDWLRTAGMQLLYDHFRRLEPNEVQQHIIAFALGAKVSMIWDDGICSERD